MKNISKKMHKMFESDVNRIILLMFLSMILSNFAHPATPGLIELRGWQKSISGVLLAVMSTSMFFSAAFFGSLGDRIGMKKIYVFMPVLYGVTQLAFGFSTNLALVFVARAIAGISSGGTHATILGSVGYASSKENKTKNIAKISSAAIFGAAIGQKVGGLLATVDTRYPFVLQFVCGVALCLFAMKFMRETNIDKQKNVDTKKSINPLSSILYIKELNNYAKFFCFIIFLSGIGGYAYSSAVNYFLKYNVKVSADVIGNYVMFSSLIAFFGTSVLLKKLISRYGEIRTYKRMLFVGVFLMAIIVFRLRMGAVSYFLMGLYAMTYEIIKSLGNSIVAKKYKTDQGKVLGVAAATSFLGTAIGSFLSGYLLSANVYLPFVINILIMGAVLVLVQTKKY